MAAMMDLKNVPDIVWKLLSQRAIQVSQSGGDVSVGVADYFYDDLYSKWSQGSKDVKYEMNLPAKGNQPAQPDAGWKTLAQKLVGFHAKKQQVGQALSDQSKGSFYVQEDNNDPDHHGTRLGENYSQATLRGRFQFVVSRGGGMVLLNRMRRACQEFIADKGGTVVGSWKVFGEAMGVGRSDSCVAYLIDEYDSPMTSTFIDQYLWPSIHDLVADQFEPIGLIRLGGKPLWALGYPPVNNYVKVFGVNAARKSYTSAGGMMGDVLGLAFEQAIATNSNPGTADALIPVALKESQDVLRRLG